MLYKASIYFEVFWCTVIDNLCDLSTDFYTNIIMFLIIDWRSGMRVPVAVIAGLPANCYTSLYLYLTFTNMMMMLTMMTMMLMIMMMQYDALKY